MNKEFTIVVPDNKVLSCVCGTNDSNLKLIEDHLGIPVFTKGNELSIENDDSSVCQKFQFIIEICFLRHFLAKNQKIRVIIDNCSKIFPYFFLKFQ